MTNHKFTQGNLFEQAKPISERKAQFLAFYRQGRSVRRAAAAAGVSRDTGERHLVRLGEPRRNISEARKLYKRYVCNEAFFESIERSEQAWLLGLLSADGGIRRPAKGHTPEVVLNLQRRDLDAVEAFARLIETDRPIYFFAPHAADGHRRQEVASLCVRSAKMVADLERLGVTERKSFTMQSWDGPPHLLPHYFRGLMDGDGCIFHTRQKQWILGLCGSLSTVEAFARWVSQRVRTRAQPVQHAGIWKVTYGGRLVARNVAALLYRDAPISLARKQRLADELLSTSEKYLDTRGNWGHG